MITKDMILAAKNAETNVEALIAVYPLIRDHVIEECASACLTNVGIKPRLGYSYASIIRNLKDKTDEAHNG